MDAGLHANLGGADFDIRDAVQAAPEPLETFQALESAPAVRARFTRRPNGRPKSISAAGTALGAPLKTGNKEQMVRDFLRAEAGSFAFLPTSRDRLRMLSMTNPQSCPCSISSSTSTDCQCSRDR